MQGEEHDQREHDDVEPVIGERKDRVDLQRAAHPFRGDHAAVERRENHPHRLLQNQADAEGGEQGFQRPSVEETNHAALDDDADDGGHQEGGGQRHQQRPLVAVGENLLHHEGGVGAQHDQLAVGHVDHAHDAEGDGQADGGQQQHRAQAQAEKNGVGGFVALGALVDFIQRALRGVAFGGGVALRQPVAQHVAHRRLQAAGHRVDGVQTLVELAGRVTQHGDVQGRVDHALDQRVGFFRLAQAQRVQHHRVGVADQALGRFPAVERVGVGQRGHRFQIADLLAQAVVDDHRARGARFGAAHVLFGDRVAQGPALLALLAQHDAVAGQVVQQLAVEQGLQQRFAALVAGTGDGLNGFSFNVEIAALELRQ